MSRFYFIAVVLLFALTTGPSANAQTSPLDDLPGRERVAPDLVPHHRNSLVAAPASGGAELTLVVGMVQRPKRRDVTGSAWLSLPLPGWFSRTSVHIGPERAQDLPNTPAYNLTKSAARHRTRRRPLLPILRTRDVRAAVAATRRNASETVALAALDGMVSRARWASLLPAVRLRATRLVDESAALSPTSYDAERTTSSGRVSLWLEARASWKLDRALFADEELRAAGQRRQLHKARRQLSLHTSRLLFGWLQAVYTARDPLNSPEQCLDAWFAEQQAVAELDVMTAGWMKRWMKRRATLPRPWCAEELFERVDGAGGDGLSGEDDSAADDTDKGSRAGGRQQPIRLGPTIARAGAVSAG